MSTHPFPARSRRRLLLGAAILLLHWLALRWLGGQLDAPHARLADDEPMMVLAQLHAPAPKPPAPALLPVRHSLPPPSPVPPPPLPALFAAESIADPELAPPAPAAPGTGDPGAAGGDGQGAVQAGAAQPLAAVQSPQAEPAPAVAIPAAPPTYKVDMPPAADVTLDVARVDADGTKWSGEALLSWKLGGGRYKVSVEAGLRMVFTRVNLLVLTSEGAVADSGFAPLTMTEKRRGRSLTATHFNRQQGSITFSASPRSYALAAGAQDKASVPLQLAAIARADPAQLSGGIDILVAEDRDASVFHFDVVGQEQIDTRLGKLHTWHLSRPPKPGSYNSRLDIWLAPARGWYPVQIRNLEASGAVTTQTVNNIVMTDTER
jgi:hypothetical protein